MRASGHCPGAALLDIAGAASAYAAFAGVLAGFAFAALIFLLTTRQAPGVTAEVPVDEPASRENHLVTALFCSFLALVISTFLYAVLSGAKQDERAAAQNASTEVVAGVAFGIAVYGLLYAVVHLITNVNLPRTGREARVLISLVAPPLIMTLIGQAALDAARTNGQETHDCQAIGSFVSASWIAPIAILAVCVGLLVLSRSRRLGAEGHHLRQGHYWWNHNFIPKMSVFVAVLAAVWVSLWDTTKPRSHLSDSEIWLWVVLSGVVLVLQTISTLWARMGDAP